MNSVTFSICVSLPYGSLTSFKLLNCFDGIIQLDFVVQLGVFIVYIARMDVPGFAGHFLCILDSPTEHIITLRITSERITSERINTERITS